jgi:hypothetical protein
MSVYKDKGDAALISIFLADGKRILTMPSTWK